MNKLLNSKFFWVAFIAAVLLNVAFGRLENAFLTMFAFGLVSTARSTNEAISETVLVRDVPDEVMVLDGDITPLTVMMVNAKRKRPCFSPRIEKLEDDLRTLWLYERGGGGFERHQHPGQRRNAVWRRRLDRGTANDERKRS